ncbi:MULTISPECIES: NADH-quinone oxidoreductase subunit N [Bacteroides]|jgi:NADH-quinone oxidoreductase subunit N|uniref:NADH-quinone oxidoreductase subunit N n=2 Tax=Bacteroides TaxID=816 RepID=A0A9X2P284_9BACE|nr:MULTISPECIES: NADH-quinone oxidoreductase subunit N [Bacteroides]MCR6503592.1 NADH-quinone oxidoreductase subunit N [Bacteroides muris (ex Fokt et al. 2023)]MCR6508657.1 NADH-quinone oxidoreductase subunit N [Bacteroides muris (ex Fokt et al. 2023)]TGY06848.1 NADH-quinone oxidoreductase subunit N [Bacteroides muris (ex Afrizal et al. 2022)]
MDYSQFLLLKEELSLILVIVILFVADLFMSPDAHKNDGKPLLNTMLPVVLLTIHTLITIVPGPVADAFGGMYHNQPIQSIVKSILSIGTLIVFLMAHEWMRLPDTAIKQGEFYILTLSTLLGMYFMISAGHFLIFFIGLETASIPMAALVAFDKYRHHSAEAGAKYILTALFSSGLLLYGLSLIYGTVGTLYFADIPARLTGDPLQIMAFVFFFSGMGFKISLVPFHLWTADVYEGAPSTVTAYLSVISKGSAAFVLMTILIKVFAPMVEQWQEVLYWVIIASITMANLFALRQQNLKRLMAFSSISQAGYIMLGVISGSAQGMTSLVYYVLIYMFANLAVFTVITIVALRAHKFTLEEYNGLYVTNPKVTFLMTLALFSLAGIPPFAGFFSKFFIFAAAFEGGFHLLVFIALANTIISLYYYLRIVKAMYINKSDEPIAAFRSDYYTRASLAICTLGIVILSIASAVYQSIDKFSFGL